MRKRGLGLSLLVALVVLCLVPGLALAADPCGVKKFNGFEMLVDLSGSRSETFQNQMALAIKIAEAVPAAGYNAAIRTFYQYPFGADAPSQLLYEPKAFDGAAFSTALKAVQMKRGARTPLGPAMAACAADLAKISGPKALLIFSDFDWSEGFGDPLAEAVALKAKMPELCIFPMSFATSDDDVKLAKEIGAASACGHILDGTNILKDEAAFKTFMEYVFGYTPCKPAPAPQPITISLHIEFDLGKHNIRAQYESQIAEVGKVMQANPGSTAVIEGHTDFRGGDAMNIPLSKNRAEAVRKYLIEKYKIAPERLTAVGFGSTKPVDNGKTEAAYQKNRRVDCVISGVLKK